ncbi:hypothetical protein ACFXHA_11055 [Nocardia sp. NPDC059240]|uniref:hypothetical protein n=1 Tax=Nocardia sp. NPDC059240 TaxID=3346786 RepID=UPI003685142E
MRSFAKFLLILGIPVAVFAAFFWHQGTSTTVSCGNKVMHAGDVCQSIRGGKSTESTYEEKMTAKDNELPVARAITLGAAGAALAGVLLLLVIPARTDEKTAAPQG